MLDEGEACDDGNRRPHDGCTADCAETYVCGDGETHPEEQCDDGGAPGGCTDFCRDHVYVAVSAGRTHTCALDEVGDVTCWGDGSPLDPTPTSPWARGQGTPPAETFTAVVAGAMTTAALRTDGTIATWGSEDDERLDAPPGAFTAIDQLWFGCALDADGEVTCWGTVDGDRMGVHDEPEGPFTRVATFGHGACARRPSGALACWGLADSPVLADVPTGAFASVACGARHCCAVTARGDVTCWGEGDEALTPPDASFESLSAGDDTTCGIVASRELRCWGGAASDAPPGRYRQVDVGGAHACAVRNDGDVVCWGEDDEGQTWAP